MIKKTGGFLLLLLVLTQLFRCAMRDNPSDPLNPAYQEDDLSVSLSLSFNKPYVQEGSVYTAKVPVWSRFILPDSLRIASSVKAVELFLQRTGQSNDSLVFQSSGSVDFTLLLADTGLYRLRLRVTNERGKVASDTVFFNGKANKIPTLHLSVSDSSALVDSLVRFSLTGSDEDGGILHVALLKNGVLFRDWPSLSDSLFADTVSNKDTLTTRVQWVAQIIDSDSAVSFDTLYTQRFKPVIPNLPPIIDSLRSLPLVVYQHDTVSFYSVSHDADGVIASRLWTFGSYGSSSTADASFKFDSVGTHTVVFRVTDDSGVTDAESLQVTVLSNILPTIQMVVQDSVVHVDTLIRITLNGNDGNGFVRTVSLFKDGVLFHQWNGPYGSSFADTISDGDSSLLSVQWIALIMDDDSMTASDTVYTRKFRPVIPNVPPVIDSMVFSPTIIYARDTVSFHSVSYDSDGVIVLRSWTFGSYGSSSAADAAFRFDSVGTHTVIFKVTDDSGATDAETLYVNIRANVPPNIISLNSSADSATVGDSIFFTAVATDTDGVIIQSVWTFGDGDSLLTTSGGHRYLTPGLFTPKFRVTDNRGASTTDSLIILIYPRVNKKPTITNLLALPGTIYEKDTVHFTANGQDSDGVVASWQWIFRSLDSSVNLVDTSILSNPNYRFNTPGNYRIKVTVRDDSGAIAQDSLQILVKPNPKPTITSFSASKVSLSSYPDTVNFSASATDSNGSIINYKFTFGDGNSVNGPLTSRSHVYTTSDSIRGYYRAVLQVMDDDSAVALDTINIYTY